MIVTTCGHTYRHRKVVDVCMCTHAGAGGAMVRGAR